MVRPDIPVRRFSICDGRWAVDQRRNPHRRFFRSSSTVRRPRAYRLIRVPPRWLRRDKQLDVSSSDFAMSLPLSEAGPGTLGHERAQQARVITEEMARPEGIEPPTLSFEG